VPARVGDRASGAADALKGTAELVAVAARAIELDPLAMPAAGWWGYWLVIDLGPAGWAAFYDGGTPSASPRSLIPQ
jgi:hypothetical protein